MRECPKDNQLVQNLGNKVQSSSVAPPNRVAPRGATSGTGGGAKCLYGITSHQKQEISPDVVLRLCNSLSTTSGEISCFWWLVIP